MLDLRRLEVLITVIDEASFSAAAEVLRISQPAVSQAIARLEADTGVPLLVRDRSGVVPTDAGGLLARHARIVLAQTRLAVDQLAQQRDQRPRPARLGAYSSAMSTLVPAAVEMFRSQVDDEARIEAQEAATDHLIDHVASGRLDAAICYDDVDLVADTRRTIRTDLFDESLEIAVGPTHPLARRRPSEPVKLGNLAQERWLTPSPDHLVVRACRAAGFEPRVAAQARDALAIRALILIADVVSLTPQLLRPALVPVTVLPLTTPVTRRVFAVTPDPPTSRSTELLNALRRSTQANPPMPVGT